MEIINFRLLLNPFNWVMVVVTLIIASIAIDLMMQFIANNRGVSDNAASNA